MKYLYAILITILSTSYSVTCYKIVALFPLPLKSHYLTFDPLMVGLAKIGHQVTVYNTFNKDTKIPNYTEVSLNDCFRVPSHTVTIKSMSQVNEDKAIILGFKNFLPKESDILNCKPLLDLANSTQSYDLMITETFYNDFFLFFAYKLKIPVILLRCNTVLPWMSNYAGLPHNPSYIPHIYAGYTSNMNFLERVKNTLYYLQALYLYKYKSEDVYNVVALKFFGAPMPPLAELTRNTSMLFLNTHFALNEVRPLVPNVIEIGGLNIGVAKKLPEDIEKFINESKHGVIYFCMGSILRGDTFKEDQRKAFLEAFSKVPQRVLWKWEGDFDDKPDNIMALKWMPQRDILAHPNIKLFISHGGLLGINEAVYEGVPILGIPIFADQKHNLKNLQEKEVAELLDHNNISTKVVLEKLQRLINDPRYSKKAKELSFRLKDRPMSPLDTAIYWTEYVIRHKGAHHLKAATVRMPWHQYLLLDVIAFIILILVLFLIILIHLLKLLLKLCNIKFNYKTNEKKRN